MWMSILVEGSLERIVAWARVVVEWFGQVDAVALLLGHVTGGVQLSRGCIGRVLVAGGSGVIT